VPPLLRSGNPLHWIPGPSQQSTLRRRVPTPPPPSPERTAATIPTTGSDASRPLCLIVWSIPCVRDANTPKRNAPHLAPRCSKCSPVVYADCAALERLPDFVAPPAARRRALAVMLYEHHREPGKLDAPARCAGTTSLSGQPIAEQAAPGRHPRPIGPRKECPAAKRRCVLASCGSSALRCRASRLAAACRLRQSGRRDRDPFTLPRSGCPVCRSRHPAAFPGRPQSPPPTAPRGVLRSRPAALAAGLARKTPCHSLQST